MQSCSTQNHTRGSWHQTELVRADLGSLMRWDARTQREDWVGPCEGLAALSSPGVKQINDCCTEAKQKQASKHQYVSNCTLHRHTWVVLLLLLLLLPSFLPSFLPHHLHFFVLHCKKTKKNTFNHNIFKQALPELLMY